MGRTQISMELVWGCTGRDVFIWILPSLLLDQLSLHAFMLNTRIILLAHLIQSLGINEVFCVKYLIASLSLVYFDELH